MEIKATLRHLHIAPRKVRLAGDLIKGMTVENAERELGGLVKRASDPLYKLLQSAIANAKHNFLVSGKAMTIKDVRVNPGPVSKRFRPRAFGRAAPIRRRTSHVSLILEIGENVVVRTREGAPMVREATLEDLRQDAAVLRERGDATDS
ncbi:MAG: 50S ribosomal protein L22, partial [Candidatus Sungiibacteriota bacterium]